MPHYQRVKITNEKHVMRWVDFYDMMQILADPKIIINSPSNALWLEVKYGLIQGRAYWWHLGWWWAMFRMRRRMMGCWDKSREWGGNVAMWDDGGGQCLGWGEVWWVGRTNPGSEGAMWRSWSQYPGGNCPCSRLDLLRRLPLVSMTFRLNRSKNVFVQTGKNIFLNYNMYLSELLKTRPPPAHRPHWNVSRLFLGDPMSFQIKIVFRICKMLLCCLIAACLQMVV